MYILYYINDAQEKKYYIDVHNWSDNINKATKMSMELAYKIQKELLNIYNLQIIKYQED